MNILKSVTSTKVQKAHYKKSLHLWLKTRVFCVYADVFQELDQRCKKGKQVYPKKAKKSCSLTCCCGF